MDKHLDKLLRKLDRPPSGPNWVRFILEDEMKTAKAILAFVKGQPPFSYSAAYSSIRDRIELGIAREDALRAAGSKGAPIGRPHNVSLVNAFFDFDDERQYSAQNPVGFERGNFLVSREIKVPIAPLSVIREQGNFVPIFLCGWNTNPLSVTQRRLLRTIYEDGFLSLTDFQDSPAEILFFPQSDTANGKARTAEKWNREDYEMLQGPHLEEQVQIFQLGREIARKLLIDQWAPVEFNESTVQQVGKDNQRDLFGE